MKSVPRRRRARSRRAVARPGSTVSRAKAPRWDCTGGRARSVGSSSAGAPPGELLLEHGALQPLALPAREIRVLDRQLRERGRPAVRKRLVQRRQLAAHQPERPAVGDDVMHVEQQRVLAGVQAQQRGADERAAAEVERRGGVLARQPPRLQVAGRLRQAREVGHREREGRGGRDHLDGLAAIQLETGAQRLVAAADLRQAARQRHGVERAAQPPGDRQVIGRVARLQLVQQPEALLGKRERRRDGAAARDAAVHRRGGPGIALLLAAHDQLRELLRSEGARALQGAAHLASLMPAVRPGAKGFTRNAVTCFRRFVQF